ncbi:complement C1s subcomponent [Eublepharis macularius]|uniref:Complement C1s subcomponent n=1 Tax=Eublepharis macularius TaxID=481883 RepID=A0AA97KLR5_EUBMA|nr:complement C1s subcomponent [Eublepharis macularius]XP_054858547.1 complement C1s subcomponent [Eublepharis macularius]XP_054858548.1 complement C1s subcomponent [Eublepharis macularius]
MELFHMGSFITCFLFTCSGAASMFGEIVSPNYPQAYPNDALESWEINVPLGFGIRLYFTHLDIEPSRNCEYDSVKVLTGDHIEGQLCGRKKSPTPGSQILKEFYVPHNSLTVTFQSDFSNEERFTGFAAYYVAVDVNECTEFVETACSHYCNNYIGGYYCSCPPAYFLHEDQKTCGVNCSGNMFTEPTGEIASPNYPSSYPENSHCDYHVVLEPGYRVVLTIKNKDFDIEPADSEGNCPDALTVSTGDQRFGPFCGSTYAGPSEIKAQSNSLDIFFHTDESTQGKGWTFYYFGDPIPCPQTVTPNSVQDPRRDRYVFTDSVKVICNEGYEIVRPEGSFTSFYSSCQSNGEWRDSHLRCEPVECGVPDDVENADIHYVTGPDLTQYQAQIRYQCHEYYAPKNKGSGIYQCSANGQWVDENEKTELPVCIPVCGVPRTPIGSAGRIFGGTKADQGNFPWQIFFENPRASGALISERWVLTAAHVLEGNQIPTMYAGLLSVGPQTLQAVQPLLVDEVFMHPGWEEAAGETRTDFDNDIALVRLREPVKMGPTISTICLPGASPEYDPPEQKLGYIAGWGRTADRRRSVVLMKAHIPVVNMDRCRSVKPESSLGSSAYRFTDNMICAGDGQSDSCNGDSGGAYALPDPHEDTRYYVGGLVSWGPKCGTYGLYTKVVNYMEWIAEVMSRQPEEEE